MSDQLPPDCHYCDAWDGSVQRVPSDRWLWMCNCCGKAWPVGEKRPEPKTDLRGTLTDQDDG